MSANHLDAVQRQELAAGGCIELGALLTLEVDGVVLAEGQDAQLDTLADEVGDAHEHGLAVPVVVLYQLAVGIDAGYVAAVVDL